jgi:hypothetical protein
MGAETLELFIKQYIEGPDVERIAAQIRERRNAPAAPTAWLRPGHPAN